MRVIIRGECIYCTAMKESFCRVLPEEEGKKCVSLIDTIGENDEFEKWVNSLPKDELDKAYEALKKRLDEILNETANKEGSASAA